MQHYKFLLYISLFTNKYWIGCLIIIDINIFTW